MCCCEATIAINEPSQGIADVFLKPYSTESYRRTSASGRWLWNCFRAVCGKLSPISLKGATRA